MVTILDENSDLWDANDVQDVAFAWKRQGWADAAVGEIGEVAPYESDDDDEDNRADLDLDVDIRAADDI